NHKDKEHIGAEAIYFDGNATALGTTRSAYPLATAVATINSLGFDGLQELAIEAQTKASQLAEKIESVGLKLIAPIITGVVPVELSSYEEVNYYKHQLITEGYKISPINIPFTDGNLFGFRVVVTPKPSMTNTMLDS